MDGVALECVPHYTYLGVPLDSRLTFELTIKELVKKVKGRLFNLAKISNMINRSTALIIYKTCIATLFDYASFFYAAAGENCLVRLQRLQNRGLRTCINTANRVHSVEELHTKSSMPMLARRRDELLVTLMRKYYGKSSEALAERGLDRQESRNTRASSKKLFALGRPNTEGYRKSPEYRGKMLWNVQLDWLKESTTKAQFKRNLKKVHNLRTNTQTRIKRW